MYAIRSYYEPQPLEPSEVVGDSGQYQFFQPCVFPDLPELAEKSIQGQGETAAAQVQIEFDLRGRGQWMDHAGHTAQLVYGVKTDHGLGAGGHGDGHPVALLQSHRGKGSRAAIDVV